MLTRIGTHVNCLDDYTNYWKNLEVQVRTKLNTKNFDGFPSVVRCVSRNFRKLFLEKFQPTRPQFGPFVKPSAARVSKIFKASLVSLAIQSFPP